MISLKIPSVPLDYLTDGRLRASIEDAREDDPRRFRRAGPATRHGADSLATSTARRSPGQPPDGRGAWRRTLKK